MPEAGFSSHPAGTVQGTAGRSAAEVSDEEPVDPEEGDDAPPGEAWVPGRATGRRRGIRRGLVVHRISSLPQPAAYRDERRNSQHPGETHARQSGRGRGSGKLRLGREVLADGEVHQAAHGAQ
jgi:hypothetical protein